MKVLALDLATRTGWAYGDAHHFDSGAESFALTRGDSPGMRYRRFWQWLQAVMVDGGAECRDTERAWAAGFFDGEGYIGCEQPVDVAQPLADGTSKTRTIRNLNIGINQAGAPELLERFRTAVGGIGYVNGPYYDKRFTPARPYWHYAASGLENARVVIEALWPWLGSKKRAQAERALTAKVLFTKRFPRARQDGVVVYEQAHHRGGAATEICVGLITKAQEFCALYGYDHLSVHSATLKKFTTGKGNASKAEMLEAVTRRWRRAEDDNEGDAIALLHYALAELVPAARP